MNKWKRCNGITDRLAILIQTQGERTKTNTKPQKKKRKKKELRWMQTNYMINPYKISCAFRTKKVIQTLLTCTLKEHFVEGSGYLFWVFSVHKASGQWNQTPAERQILFERIVQ